MLTTTFYPRKLKAVSLELLDGLGNGFSLNNAGMGIITNAYLPAWYIGHPYGGLGYINGAAGAPVFGISKAVYGYDMLWIGGAPYDDNVVLSLGQAGYPEYPYAKFEVDAQGNIYSTGTITGNSLTNGILSLTGSNLTGLSGLDVYGLLTAYSMSTNTYKTPSMPTSDPADTTGTLWYDTITNLVYRGT
jgi:hypothetical protein